jgi:non-homologous end joining protein Ku
LRALIEAKAAGKKIVAPCGPEEPHVINLMDALRRSLEDVQKGHGRERPTASKRASRPRHHTGRRRTG